MSSIVTQEIQKWDNLAPSIQSRIVDYYHKLYLKCAKKFCLDNLDDIISASQYSRKTSHGLRGGIVVLDWTKESQNDNAVVSIVPGDWDAISNMIKSSDSLSEEESKFFLDIAPLLYESHKKPDSVYIYSVHNNTETSKKYPYVGVFYLDENEEEVLIYVDQFPYGGISFPLDPSVQDEILRRNQSRSKPKQPANPLEIAKEDELYDWLRLSGIDAERQVPTSSKHFLDIWVPGKLVIEVKRGTVSGNDVCQCIEYASEYSIPILLVGEKISGAASRGLKGFNSLCPDRKIMYVSWDTAYDFLTGYLKSK